jgi:hypothetical protein
LRPAVRPNLFFAASWADRHDAIFVEFNFFFKVRKGWFEEIVRSFHGHAYFISLFVKDPVDQSAVLMDPAVLFSLIGPYAVLAKDGIVFP